MRILLLQVRDGDQTEALSAYPKEICGFHAALLVNEGYAEGRVLKDRNGQYTGAAIANLTSCGYNFLEEFELQPKPHNSDFSMNLEIFISHSSKDSIVAECLIDLLQRGLNLRSDAIRCTSVNGYRLPGGASTDEILRREVKESRIFLGLVTPHSVQSAYVLFELGARWGAGLHFMPLLASGADSTFLKGPLSGFNALDCGSEEQMHQLIDDIGRLLSVKASSPASYNKALKTLVKAAGIRTAAKPVEVAGHISDEGNNVMRFAAATGGTFHPRDYARAVGISELKAQHFGELLETRGLLSHGYNAVGIYFSLTKEGRAFVVERGLEED